MGIREKITDGRANLVISNRDNSSGAAQNNLQGQGIGNPAGYPVSHRVDNIGRDLSLRVERKPVGRRTSGSNTNDFGVKPQRIAEGDHPADSGSHSDTNVNYVQPGAIVEQL